MVKTQPAVLGLIPGCGRPSGGGNGTPLHILAWKIPWAEVPGGLQSMESQRVRRDLATEHACSNDLTCSKGTLNTL